MRRRLLPTGYDPKPPFPRDGTPNTADADTVKDQVVLLVLPLVDFDAVTPNTPDSMATGECRGVCGA